MVMITVFPTAAPRSSRSVSLPILSCEGLRTNGIGVAVSRGHSSMRRYICARATRDRPCDVMVNDPPVTTVVAKAPPVTPEAVAVVVHSVYSSNTALPSSGWLSSVCGVSVEGTAVSGAGVCGGSVSGMAVSGAGVGGGWVFPGVSVDGNAVSGASVFGASVPGASVAGGSVAGGSVAGGSVSGMSVISIVFHTRTDPYDALAMKRPSFENRTLSTALVCPFMSRMRDSELSGTHIFTFLSPPPADTMYAPLAEYAMEFTHELCPRKVASAFCVARSQMITVLSNPPLATFFPSGE